MTKIYNFQLYKLKRTLKELKESLRTELEEKQSSYYFTGRNSSGYLWNHFRDEIIVELNNKIFDIEVEISKIETNSHV
jgi:hypothetical protein